MSFRSYYCCDRRYLGHDCNCPSPTQYGEALCRMLTDDGVLTAQESPPTDRDLLQRAAEALGEIAKGSNGYRAGGGFVCDWCGNAGAECWADSHPKTCPRTIARSALSAIEARLKETA